MRAYFWGNMYLSSIQQGIQAAHCVSDMFVRYSNDQLSEQYDYLLDWADEHKTMILLNGGFSENLSNLKEFFEDEKNPYPFMWFNEEEAALNGAMTCVGIILPEKIYKTAALVRADSSLLEDIWEEGELELTNHPDTQSIVKYDWLCGTSPFKWTYNSWEVKLIEEMNKYSLAN